MSHQPNTYPQIHKTSCFDATPDSPPPFWQPVPLLVLEASVAVLHSEGDRANFEGHLLHQRRGVMTLAWKSKSALLSVTIFISCYIITTCKLYDTLRLIFSIVWAFLISPSNLLGGRFQGTPTTGPFLCCFLGKNKYRHCDWDDLHMVSVTIDQLIEGRLWGCTYPKSPRTFLRVLSMRSEVVQSPASNFQDYLK